MPDQFGAHANQFRNDYTREQNEQYTAEFSALTEQIRAAMADGLASNDAAVQELIGQHYAFISQFWSPTRSAYTSLAMSYILPSPYRDYYEGVAPGLGKYHYDAIVTWASQHLSDEPGTAAP